MKNNLILLTGLILCISSSVICVKLENLCRQDIFEYDGIQVNAVHSVKLERTFANLGDFAITENENYNFVANKTLKEAMLNIKREYNRKIVQMYSERYVNGVGLNNVESEIEIFGNLSQRAYKLYLQTNNDNRAETTCKKTSEYIETKGDRLVEYLTYYKNNQFQQGTYKDGHYEMFENLINKLEIEKNQTMAFENYFLSEVFEKQIISKPTLKLNRFSKVIQNFKTNGTFTFFLALPFYNSNYLGNGPCIFASSLPKFFVNKGD